MFEKDPFGARIKAKAQAEVTRKQEAASIKWRINEDARLAAAAREEEFVRQRRERLRAVYEQPRTATSPDSVFSSANSELCAEFLSHMNKKLFKKTVKITEQIPTSGLLQFKRNWSMNAYQIGRMEYAQRTKFSELYLCVDGMLRARTVSSLDVLPSSPHIVKVIRYEGLPESNTEISFGSYGTRTKENVKIIPPRYQNNMGPEGPGAGAGYLETRIVTKTQEVIWQPVNSLEERLIQIATNRHQPFVENS